MVMEGIIQKERFLYIKYVNLLPPRTLKQEKETESDIENLTETKHEHS